MAGSEQTHISGRCAKAFMIAAVLRKKAKDSLCRIEYILSGFSVVITIMEEILMIIL